MLLFLDLLDDVETGLGEAEFEVAVEELAAAVPGAAEALKGGGVVDGVLGTHNSK